MPSGGLTPSFLIEIAIEPKSKADRERLDVALAKLADQDPLFRASTDPESGQTILAGASELHLDAKVGQLKREGIECRIGAPQVAFRESVTRRVEHSYTHKKQANRAGQFAAVTLLVEPSALDGGYVFESKAGGAVPETYIPAIEKGLRSVLSSGVVAGFPVVDVKVTLVDAKFHDTDSSAVAFEIATRACFREALQKAGAVLLEPIMKVDVETPRDFAEVILKDLRLRRGKIIGESERDDTVIIQALVPLMNMFGYVDALRQNSMGRASFTVQFDHYAPVYSPDDDPFAPAIGKRA